MNRWKWKNWPLHPSTIRDGSVPSVDMKNTPSAFSATSAVKAGVAGRTSVEEVWS
jgi:hypothetical protein